MKCIEAQQLVKPYIEKQLSDKQLVQFLDHVEHCPECYEELEIYFSIYETLGSSDKDQGKDAYDFEGKLIQDIKNTKRYLRLRKAYRFFRFAVVLVAELLLVFAIITGIEMHGEEGSRGTTIYRVIYGDDEKIGIKFLSESEMEALSEHATEKESQGSKEKLTERSTEAVTEESEIVTEREVKAAAEKDGTVTETGVNNEQRKDRIN